jgi:hypothetical protein
LRVAVLEVPDREGLVAVGREDPGAVLDLDEHAGRPPLPPEVGRQARRGDPRPEAGSTDSSRTPSR